MYLYVGDIMRKIWTLVRKEWAEVFKNRFVLFSVAFLPLLFTALPLVMLYFMGTADGANEVAMTSDMPPQFTQLCEEMNAQECMQYFMISQFMLLFMMVPMIVPITFASYSIVGEKSTRTLEPLLATPITTVELLLGKSIAATLPAVAATWLSFFLYAIGTMILAISPAVTSKLFDALWLSDFCGGSPAVDRGRKHRGDDLFPGERPAGCGADICSIYHSLGRFVYWAVYWFDLHQ